MRDGSKETPMGRIMIGRCDIVLLVVPKDDRIVQKDSKCEAKTTPFVIIRGGLNWDHKVNFHQRANKIELLMKI